MSFLYSGIQHLFSSLNCNSSMTEAPMLYIASRLIVQGYSPHKMHQMCILCTFKENKNASHIGLIITEPSFLGYFFGILTRNKFHYGPVFFFTTQTSYFGHFPDAFQIPVNKKINFNLQSVVSPQDAATTREHVHTHTEFLCGAVANPLRKSHKRRQTQTTQPWLPCYAFVLVLMQKDCTQNSRHIYW